MLKKLRDRLKAIQEEIRGINDAAEREQRAALTPEEDARYAELRAERETVEARIGQLEDEEKRRAKLAGAEIHGDGDRDRFVVTDAPQVYGRGSRNSYFLDLARYQLRHEQLPAAVERLNRHAQEVDVDLPRREAARRARAERGLQSLDEEYAREYQRDPAASSFFRACGASGPGARQESNGEAELRVNPNRVDGQGGYFVPPLWLVDQYIPYLRNGRPFANSVRSMDLPPGTDSVNIPKVNSGTTVDVQTDGGAVSSTDITDSFVSAPVRTLAGQQDIAMQLLDQSPINFDQVLFPDLLADYARKVDVQCLSGSGINGQLKGIDNVSGTNTVTYTSASPLASELYPILGQALSQLTRNRKLADGLRIWFQGTRWWWLATRLDGSLRPFIVEAGPFNAMGTGDSVSQGPVGRMLWTPTNVDLNITTTDGAGTNQDRIYVNRGDDLYLFEGAMRSRALQEVLSGTLQIRFQIYNYIAFMPDRYAVSTSIISGTGLVAPAGF
jgi:hypothetical protein